MAAAERKLSLVATFDDICRRNVVQSEGVETGMIKFFRNLDDCRRRWLAAEEEITRLKCQLAKVEAESRLNETKLTHVRNSLDLENRMRKQVELERDTLERQISLIRDLLMDSNIINDQTREKFAFLSHTTAGPPRGHSESPSRRLNTINESTGSVLSPSDYSYDKTDEDLDLSNIRSGGPKRRSGGRRPDELFGDSKRRASAPLAEEIIAGKRKKSNTYLDVRTNEPVVATTTVTVSSEGPIRATSHILTRSMMNRTQSAPTPDNKHSPDKYPTRDVDSDESFWNTPNAAPRANSTRRTSNTPMRVSSSRLTNRAHTFQTKTVIKPETCTPCGKKIKFGKHALRCSDCRALCHVECKHLVPLPCVPTVSTPSSKGGLLGTIADYTPPTEPMVPALVIHCVNEVEARGLAEIGIYRVPGSEREVKDLKERFLRGKGVPNLSQADIHVICGCLKDFLRSLREPIVTHTHWKDFVAAAEAREQQVGSQGGMYQAIGDLPQPNRDTLAFIIIHLQKVASSPETKMPASNLAKIFGPTIVGYSTPDPEPQDMLKETKLQALVMEKLIAISGDYWSGFINTSIDTTDENDGGFTGYNTLLGPYGTPRSRLGTLRGQTIGSASKQNPTVGFKGVKRPDRFFSPIIK